MKGQIVLLFEMTFLISRPPYPKLACFIITTANATQLLVFCGKLMNNTTIIVSIFNILITSFKRREIFRVLIWLEYVRFKIFYFLSSQGFKLPVAGFGGAVVSIVGSIIKKTYVFESIISLLRTAIFHFAAYEIYLLVQ